MSQEIITKICEEVDAVLSLGKEDYPHLRELVIEVIKDDKGLPKKFVDMIYDIHEADSFTTYDETEAKELNFYNFEGFKVFLKETKEKNIEFWNNKSQ